MIIKLIKKFFKSIINSIKNIKTVIKEDNEKIAIIDNHNINYNEKYVKKYYLLTQTELKFYKLEMNLLINYFMTST